MNYTRLFLTIVSPLLLLGSAKAQSSHSVDSCHCEQCIDIKIGQMLVAGFRGTVPSPEIIQAITEYHIGGVILFDVDVSNHLGERNISSPKQLAELSSTLQSLATANRPLFVAIDQEGGRVNRLKPAYGFPPSLSAAKIGRIGDIDSTHFYARVMASTMAEGGINLDFAPCVDLSLNPHNPIIAGKERAYSADDDSVVMHAEIVIEELHRKSILTSLKHFPGHGSSRNDSHLGLVDITDCWDPNHELAPYRRLIAGGYDDIIMVGHLVHLDVDTLPASLSKVWVTDRLRQEERFDGVIATDDLNMGAIVDHYSLEKALNLAINAGVNMIIMGNNARVFEPDLVARSHRIIRELVASGAVSMELIDDSYRRLMLLKTRILPAS